MRLSVIPEVRLAAASVVVALALAGCGSQEPGQPTPSPTTPVPTSSAPVGTATLPVYYLTDTPDGLRLAREFQEAPVPATAAGAALELMLRGDPADPDYASPWNPAARVRSVVVSDEAITVDLSAQARTASVGSEAAQLAVQQLVYTATGAEQSDAPVVLLIEGEPAGELWGHVVWDGPIAREPVLDVRLLVQINEPANGAVVPRTFTMTGEAATFEAVLPWKILDAAGDVVQQGTAMTSDGTTLAPFETVIGFTGEPGQYTLLIEPDDPSDGAAGPLARDTKVITIG